MQCNPVQTYKRPLVSAKEICSYFDISDVTLWRWYTLGSFPKPTYPGRDRRFDWAEIEAWEKSQNQQKIEN